MKQAVGTAAVGALLGFVLSRSGFSSWDEIHRMFTLQSWRLVLLFGGAVLVLMLGWWLIRILSKTKPNWALRPIHPGTAIGGAVFGAGWAISGACPSIALVQIGEGKLAAAFTLVGIFVGNWLYSRVHERYFRWSTSSCTDD